MLIEKILSLDKKIVKVIGKTSGHDYVIGNTYCVDRTEVASNEIRYYLNNGSRCYITGSELELQNPFNKNSMIAELKDIIDFLENNEIGGRNETIKHYKIYSIFKTLKSKKSDIEIMDTLMQMID
jgi:hypothetical protein